MERIFQNKSTVPSLQPQTPPDLVHKVFRLVQQGVNPWAASHLSYYLLCLLHNITYMNEY